MPPHEHSNTLYLSRRESDEYSDNSAHHLSPPVSPSFSVTDTLSPTSTAFTDYGSDHDDYYEAPPLVLVAGFLAPSSKASWDPLEEIQELAIRDEAANGRWLLRRKFILVTPGMCSSLHDRACEIFAQLKGGRVDYGEEHSSEEGHGRYGRVYEGLYPQWSATHPLHFVGHSLGGPTIYKLQELLATGFFATAGHTNTSADWMRSLTGLSAPFRGTTAVYLLGTQPYPHPPGDVNPLSFGGIAYRALHLYEHLVPASLRRALFDLQVDHWDFSAHGLWNCLRKSPWAEGKDNAPYDLCVGARWRDWEKMRESKKWSGVGARTWYRSFATNLVAPPPTPTTLSTALTSLPLRLLSYWVQGYRFTPGTSAITPAENAAAPNSFSLDPAVWGDNDGICCVVGQYHPGACKRCGGWYAQAPVGVAQKEDDEEDDSLPCLHRRSLNSRYAHYGAKEKEQIKDDEAEDEKPGVWHVTEVAGATHLDLGMWNGSDLHWTCWTDIVKWLGRVDEWAVRG
ncbi:hypothetical protein BC938DRAFT_471605 [Jimgerdemannia flammicorona]|uniref:Lipase-like C-terminal domain-containing protein n=1 Tax=Jimgerdemannia flammicorona TaxID=994334 RepID=A0A433Q7T6_9FUNG|nr:hypothetical protein BC938DRAFT_471605 [Jimgerdemannia flammicorona]